MIYLPQNDPNLKDRTLKLNAQLNRYQYDYQKLPGIPILNNVPKEDESLNSFEWVRIAVSLLLRLRANQGLQDSEKRGQFCQLVQYFYLSLFIADPKKTVDVKRLWSLLLFLIRLVQRLSKIFSIKPKVENYNLKDSNPVGRFINRLRIKFLIPESTKTITSPRTSIKERESQRYDFLDKISNKIESNLSFTDYHRILKPYKDIFQIVYLPEVHKYFNLDQTFAAQRVAGINPLVIERIAKLPEKFPLSEAQYKEVMGSSDSLEKAGQEGRLYLTDYQVLDSIKSDDFPSAQKYSYAPLALFAVPAETGKSRSLVPVAIQCKQNPGSENPIFTPPPLGTPQSGQWGWLIAKTIVQIADGNYHELISHLGRTHLLIEIFAIATPRKLAVNHPLFVLLQPHFEGTLFINDAALKGLIQPKGTVNAVLAGTLEESLRISGESVKGFPYSFNDSSLPKTLAARGVHEVDKLPDYPYRDDALLLWDAISSWTSDYLDLYYKDDEDVMNDMELQNWLKDLVASDGGQMKGIGEPDIFPPEFRTKKYLSEAITLIIFTASVQHAAVNFPQAAYLTYGPNMPLAGYRPAPTQTSASAKDYLALLPSLAQTETQMNMVYTLGSVYYTRLGQYQAQHFMDKDVQPLLTKFQLRLQEIGLIIDDRNKHRPTYYDYLHPTKIPQSINI